jgi:hypothetical protein
VKGAPGSKRARECIKKREKEQKKSRKWHRIHVNWARMDENGPGNAKKEQEKDKNHHRSREGGPIIRIGPGNSKKRTKKEQKEQKKSKKRTKSRPKWPQSRKGARKMCRDKRRTGMHSPIY